MVEKQPECVLLLKVFERKEISPLSISDPSAQSRTGRVLLVEDNETNRFIVGRMVQAEGHQVVFAQDGYEGLRKAQECKFDLILMDISMPGMDGVEATIHIRHTVGPSQNATIFGLTAHALLEEIEGFLAAGMQGCLIKPLRTTVLRDVLVTLDDFNQGERDDISLIDGDILLELYAAMERSAFVGLLVQVVDEIEEARAHLSQYVSNSSYEQLARCAHKVAGSAAVVGASGLQQSAAALETAAKFPDRAKVVERFSEFDAKAVETATVLREYRHGL